MAVSGRNSAAVGTGVEDGQLREVPGLTAKLLRGSSEAVVQQSSAGAAAQGLCAVELCGRGELGFGRGTGVGDGEVQGCGCG